MGVQNEVGFGLDEKSCSLSFDPTDTYRKEEAIEIGDGDFFPNASESWSNVVVVGVVVVGGGWFG